MRKIFIAVAAVGLIIFGTAAGCGDNTDRSQDTSQMDDMPGMNGY